MTSGNEDRLAVVHAIELFRIVGIDDLSMSEIYIRPLTADDRPWLSRLTVEKWGSRIVVSKGTVYEPENLQGFKAVQGGKTVGVLTYHVHGKECEIVTINSLEERVGVGSSLLAAARDKARSLGCRRLWLITTNDNLNALRFYQRWGLHIVAVYPDAMERSRKLKPSIPLVGDDGIPLRDELELELPLESVS